MMRNTYHLTILKEDDNNFQRVVKDRKFKIEQRITINGNTIKPEVQYMIKLSKYEFLYIRLSVRILNAVNVDEWNLARKVEA